MTKRHFFLHHFNISSNQELERIDTLETDKNTNFVAHKYFLSFRINYVCTSVEIIYFFRENMCIFSEKKDVVFRGNICQTKFRHLSL